MQYFDSGARDQSQALAKWLEDVTQEDVKEVRIQSGYYSLDGIGLLIPVFEHVKQNDLLTKVLIGSNDGCTLRSDVAELMHFIGVPRPNGQLGIVSFSGAHFHPKTYHIRRQDNTEAAFVGSANLTRAGLAINIEAGIAFDTRKGDDPNLLSQIGKAIDAWFSEKRDGITIVTDIKNLDELSDSGILAIASSRRLVDSEKEGSASLRNASPKLKPIFQLPPVKQHDTTSSSSSTSEFEIPDLPEEALQEDNVEVETPPPAPEQTGNYRAFLMTLQKTDVGLGQVTEGTSPRSPEIFIPLSARNADPDFWGWQNQFTEDAFKPGKMDRTGVKMRIGTTIIDVNMMTWPDKSDFRLRSEHLRSAGNIGDIIYLERSNGKSGFTYFVEVFPQGSALYAQHLKYCVNATRNSKKLWGYI